jgi:hypothetical protein
MASGQYSTVAGGNNNSASNTAATVSGGASNQVSGVQATVSGGGDNLASGNYSAVAGGSQNTASGSQSTVSGGSNNTAGPSYATVAGGRFNTASANYAVVAGGYQNAALGQYSFAAGYAATSTVAGAFTWADSEGTSVVNNQANRTWFKNKGGFLATASTNTADGGLFLNANNYVGVGTLVPTSTLTVVGTFKLVDGTQGAGKVLTSDASGRAAWQGLAIGDSYGGGKIFWLDASGKHGLIAAEADQSAAIQWWSNTTQLTGANLSAVYAGKADTVIISTTLGAGSYAAKLCNDYAVTVNNEYYDDWYLPSKWELDLLCAQKALVGGFASNFYWSSTEYDTGSARLMDFSGCGSGINAKVISFYVRCVRAGP